MKLRTMIILVFIIAALGLISLGKKETQVIPTPLTQMPTKEMQTAATTPTTTPIPYAYALQEFAQDAFGEGEVMVLEEYTVQLIKSTDPNYGGQVAQTYQGPSPSDNNTQVGPPCVAGESFYNPGYYKFSAKHPGIDGRCTKSGKRGDDNALIAAVANGIVRKYFPMLSPSTSDAAFYWVSGKTYFIEHNISGAVCYSIYGHLSEGYLTAGDVVTAGQAIGVIGKTGLANNIVHLHFGFFCERSGNLIAENPLNYNILGLRQ